MVYLSLFATTATAAAAAAAAARARGEWRGGVTGREAGIWGEAVRRACVTHARVTRTLPDTCDGFHD